VVGRAGIRCTSVEPRLPPSVRTPTFIRWARIRYETLLRNRDFLYLHPVSTRRRVFPGLPSDLSPRRVLDVKVGTQQRVGLVLGKKASACSDAEVRAAKEALVYIDYSMRASFVWSWTEYAGSEGCVDLLAECDRTKWSTKGALQSSAVKRPLYHCHLTVISCCYHSEVACSLVGTFRLLPV